MKDLLGQLLFWIFSTIITAITFLGCSSFIWVPALLIYLLLK